MKKPLLQSSLAVIVWSLPLLAATADTERPNILWITIEDWSADLSCYGTRGIQTPHIDRLADQGIRYEWAFSTGPVCSTSRSAMVTGFHQNYIGAQNHREYDKQPLPFGIGPIPHLLKEAGYYTVLLSKKVDCNFLPDRRDQLFMGTDWKQRDAGQPFFARITFGGTHRPWRRDPERPIEISDIELPPYYADTPFCRRDWANGLEQMQLVDRQVGALLARLENEGLAKNTLVFFTSDHGRCHIRGKQFLYDGGIRIPLIARWPGRIRPGQVSTHLVSSIDICATVLEAAGVKPPVPLHGRSLFTSELGEREYIFAARDRMGDTHDAMRCVRSRTHKLILNLMPERAWCQYSGYKESSYPMLAEMNLLNLQGKLTPVQAAFLAEAKPRLELFDLRTDPHETVNLAGDANYAEIKKTLLAVLDDWRANVIRDAGVSKDFRAAGIFPASSGGVTVHRWVNENKEQYDFRRYGLPPWYPTRPIEGWQGVRQRWAPFVFRKPTDNVPRPNVNLN